MKIVVNAEYLEKEFLKAAPATNLVRGPAKTEGIVRVTLLGPERAKNMEMVLMKLKLPYSELARALLECDEKVLTLPNLESLDVICPNEEEV